LRLRCSHEASGPSSNVSDRGRRTDAITSRIAGIVVATRHVRPGVFARVLTQMSVVYRWVSIAI
jgi:hypothetical protein